MGSLSWVHWAIVLVIVVLVFGTKKLKNMGSDLGSAVKGFKDGMKDGTAGAADKAEGAAGQVANAAGTAAKDTIDVEAKQKS